MKFDILKELNELKNKNRELELDLIQLKSKVEIEKLDRNLIFLGSGIISIQLFTSIFLYIIFHQ